jgi:RHS repeat-associated protein/uncharacterized repeat protein (TIGR01451 family)
MQAPRSFTKVTLDTGSGNTGDYPRGYQVFVSADGSTWGSAVATGSGSSQVTTITFPMQVGRYVKVVQTGTSSTNKWSIAELNVYGTPPALILRDNWTASASLDNSEAGLGIDGRVETQWSTNTAQAPGMSYQVDMKVVQSFNEIVLDVECNPADYPRGVQVFVSNNGTTWGSAIASATGTAAIVTVAFAPQSARYLKVVSTASASNYWGIAELNVLNTNPSACSAACVALDACHDVGTCDPSTGVCSNPAKANGTTCNDGNACTQTDTCQAGVCTGGNAVTCTASDQCHVAGTCNTSTGVCSNPVAANGTACPNATVCDGAETCQAGVCTPGTPPVVSDGNPCTADACDPVGGVTHTNVTNGTACPNATVCDGAETCQAGVCTPGTPPVVNDGNPCTTDACDPVAGVTHTNVANGTGCPNGNVCDGAETCQAGVCTSGTPLVVNDGNPCTADACDPVTGVSHTNVANGTGCPNGNVCDGAETCQSGSCTPGTPPVVNDGNPCTADACDPVTGVSHTNVANGTACPDANVCNGGETCQAGTCTPGTPLVVDDGNPCTADACDPVAGVSHTNVANGTACPNATVCDGAETCQSGACTAGTPLVVDDGNPCTADACDPVAGVSHVALSDGSSCSDGNACTQGDSCHSGTCNGTSVVCAASDQCHLGGVCNPATGACSNPAKADGTTCDDGNPATQTDTCHAGTCAGVSGPACQGEDDCDDGNPCTTDDHCFNGHCTGELTTCSPSTGECASYCDPATGQCTNHPAADGTACDDGNMCTTGDVCTAGACGGVGTCTGQVSVNAEAPWSANYRVSLPVSTTADHTAVHPGDAVGLTVQATFDGINVNSSGLVDVVNNSPSDFPVPGFSISLEYLSPATNQWVTLERFDFDTAAQPLPPTTPGRITFIGLATGGVTVKSGHTQPLFIDPTIFVPQSALTILNDPTQSSGVREAFRFDETPGLPSGAEVLTLITFPIGSTLTLSNLAAHATFDNVSVSLSPSSASVPLGSTQTFTGVGHVAALLTPDQALHLAGYLPYLQNLAQKKSVAQASVSTSGSGFGSGTFVQVPTLQLPTTIPIVLPTMVSGPTTLPAGFTGTYGLTLTNQGNDAASHIVVQDSTSSSTATAPTTLAIGETEPATLVYHSNPGFVANSDVVGQVTWQDAVGNVYGPTTSSWPTNFTAALPLGLITLAGQPTHPIPVESEQDFTATTVDPTGNPVAGVTVQLTVTGVNPQVLSAVTDGSGVAAFSYHGQIGGGDLVVASGTITTAPTQSSTATVFWSAPYGTPCQSPDVPLDVVIAIDTSSSMEGAPLEGAKAAAHAFLNTLDLSRDQLGIVSFGGVSTLNSTLTSNFATVSAGIDSVAPGGGFINPTSIGAGLSAALDEITSARARPGATPIIVFVSDGGNSFGDPEPALARLATSGIRTFAFALGPDVDIAMLKRIASSKNDLFYVPTSDELVWLYSNLRNDVCRNQVPLANAGGNQGAYSVRLPHQLTLHGDVHDDGPVATLTSEWTFVSGPAPVTFLDASSPETVALFTEPGTYVLRLSASDGEFTGTDDATITVDSEPSLAGASVVATLGTPGPLTVGTSESLVTTLKDSGGTPIADFPIQVTITGPDAQTATIVTDANGIATFTYTGAGVGTDVLTTVALGTVQLTAAAVSVAWTAPVEEQVVTQGWIGSPTHQSTVKGSVGITVGDGVTLTSGTVSYWPFSAPDQVHTLATGASGGPGAVIANLDTTVLANGPWVVKLDGTDDQGHSQISEAAVTVSGDYKPGRDVVEETDLTIPLVGIPVTVGRRYDSLEKDNVGDFGHGWSLMLGHPRLEVDPAHNVTITMPDNRRVTFYFQATSATASITFAWLYTPGFVPEAGTFGSLTSDGCDLMVLSGGQLVCFLDNGLDFAPTTYKYTDPYGRVFTMAASGELKSITDRQQNTLTFTPSGISSNSGMSITFDRDAQGRITQITSPPIDLGNGKIFYQYAYDADGNLSTVTLADGTTENFTYSADHRLLTTKDPNGHVARTSTYDDAGHLLTDTDALGNVTSYAYDFGAHTTTITNPDNGTVQQTFDDRGLLLKEVDPLGRTTQHTYDANRNELTRTNALGEVTTMTYDANGNQTSIKNGRDETTHITYNALSEPLTSTDPAGHTTTIAYDDQGIPTRFSDELGTLATFTSSEHGLPVSVTDAAGNSAYLVYDGTGNLTSRTDRLGRTARNTYDGVGRLTAKIDPRGNGTSYAYSPRGPKSKKEDDGGVFGQRSFGYLYDGNLNLTTENSDLGRFTNYTYDVLNHLTKVEHTDHTTIQYTRDFRGNPLTVTDESGRVMLYEYDKAGQLKKTTFPDGTFTKRDYDDLGRLVTATDERGNATTYEYEAGCGCAERVTKVTDPLGRATAKTYDAVGRRASVADAAGHVTSYAYDVRGLLTTTTYADATTEVDAFDVLGRRTSHTDQMGSVTQYGYDAEGQLTSVTDPLAHVTLYGYDASGNLTSVTDANGHTTTYAYDYLNRKSQRTLPLGMNETWTYNMYGDNLTHVDFRGKTTTMTYDGLARMLTKVPDPGLGEPTVTFTYNPTGTRATMADASGSTAYGYDTRDRLLTKATPAGTLTYAYDAAGKVASIRSSNVNGTSVDYGWDAANQLVSVQDNRAGGVTTFAYTSTGHPRTLTHPSGVRATYSYDTRDNVSSLNWSQGTNLAFESWSYTLNGRGQRLTVRDAMGRQAAFGYDAAARLISETVTGDPSGPTGNGELAYSLDPAGNRLSTNSTLAAIPSAGYSLDANDQLSKDGYDLNGNTTNADGHTYTFDFENRLRSKDGGAVTITYDGDGNRATKTAQGVTTRYLVDDVNPTGYLQVLEEVASGAVKVEYTYALTVVSQTRMLNGGPQTRYYVQDAHGNVTGLTDTAGAVTDTYDYDAWGNVVSSSGVTVNTRLFAGEELDPDVGLINLRARQYNPSTGRFFTLDPLDLTTSVGPADMKLASAIASVTSPYTRTALELLAPDHSRWEGRILEPLNWNRTIYANADPVNRFDPTGRDDTIELILIHVAAYNIAVHLSELLLQRIQNERPRTESQRLRSNTSAACTIATDGAEIALIGAGINPWVPLGFAVANMICTVSALILNGLEE